MTSEACPQSEFSKPKHSKVLLDVEDTRQKTKESLVFSLLKEKKRTSGTFKIAPSLSLQKVKEFLPQLKSANVKIQEELTSDPSKQTKYDIENVEGENGRIIEMDLALYEDTDSDCSISSVDTGADEANTGLVDESNIKFPGGNFKSNLVQVIENDHEEENVTIPV